MPNYIEPTKNDVTYDEPNQTGWFTGGWFNTAWFGKKIPNYTEPEKTTPNYTEPNKGD